jgi:hypothetical protein
MKGHSSCSSLVDGYARRFRPPYTKVVTTGQGRGRKRNASAPDVEAAYISVAPGRAVKMVYVITATPLEKSSRDLNLEGYNASLMVEQLAMVLGLLVEGFGLRYTAK